MREAGERTSPLVLGTNNGEMEIIIKEISKMGSSMGKEDFVGLMDPPMRDSGQRAKFVVKECIVTTMGGFTKGIGNKI